MLKPPTWMTYLSLLELDAIKFSSTYKINKVALFMTYESLIL